MGSGENVGDLEAVGRSSRRPATGADAGPARRGDGTVAPPSILLTAWDVSPGERGAHHARQTPLPLGARGSARPRGAAAGHRRADAEAEGDPAVGAAAGRRASGDRL